MLLMLLIGENNLLNTGTGAMIFTIFWVEVNINDNDDREANDNDDNDDREANDNDKRVENITSSFYNPVLPNPPAPLSVSIAFCGSFRYNCVRN